jgi:hypothetical protein
MTPQESCDLVGSGWGSQRIDGIGPYRRGMFQGMT